MVSKKLFKNRTSCFLVLVKSVQDSSSNCTRRVKSASYPRKHISLFHPVDATTASILKRKQKKLLPEETNDSALDVDKKYYLRFPVSSSGHAKLEVEEKSF